ncbi:DUF2264 domain-containing protein [Streptacidiphilus sp. N1-12]|uniref:DUF2264 domain-containing protein n=2 Tax=Streptacidiphilus alkalitolerans TaxID=3342712 RepID=A0ABV6WNR2_9ACTN
MPYLRPAEDRELSPYTGWTRAHWERLADRMLDAVRPHATPGQALIHLPGPVSSSGRHSDGLEGYARTFLLAAFRIAGARGAGGTEALAERYAAGLAAGTDPASPERWPRMSECGQAKVEAASIALGLHETRPWIWDRLDDRVRQRVVDWFSEMVGTEVPDNNWVWFRAIVEAFLRSVGGPWKPADLAHTVARTESWYAGGGWYSDGADTPPPFRNYDHYSGWAMHLYPLWYCRISGDSADAAEAGLADRYRARLRDYLTDLQYLVGADGAPLYQGRSLTYRYAAAAPFWAGELFGADALAPGLTRRIGSGMVRHFTDRADPDDSGLLSLGWYRPHPPIRQNYSGPASPYWASKSFAGLLLPADHPAWTEAEQPLPVDLGDFVRTLHAPGWVASGTRADGIVRIANHGADHADRGQVSGAAYDPFYCRWAYSTATGPELGGPGPVPGPDGAVHASTPDLDLPGGGPLDSHVALVDAQGRPTHRRPLERLALDGPAAASRHRARRPQDGSPQQPREPEPWLTTASVLHGAWEVRAVRVDGDPAGAALRIGGWAVAGDRPPVLRTAEGRASVRNQDGLQGLVVALHGPLRAGVRASVGRTSFAEHAAVAYLETPDPARAGGLYVAAIALGREPGEPPELVADGPQGEWRIHWPDGQLDRLPLGANVSPTEFPQE